MSVLLPLTDLVDAVTYSSIIVFLMIKETKMVNIYDNAQNEHWKDSINFLRTK